MHFFQILSIFTSLLVGVEDLRSSKPLIHTGVWIRGRPVTAFLPLTAAMPLKPWQIALIGFEQAGFVAFCVYVLAASRTSFGGDKAPVWSHRTFQMTLMIVSSASYCALAWAVPKRQIFFLSLLLSAGQFTFACDTVWKCPRVHFFVW